MNKEQIMNTEQERAQPAAATAAPSDEHATCNLQLATQEPVACAFFTEKGEVAYTGLFDRTLKALEAVKTTRLGISSGSIDLYATPQPTQAPEHLLYRLRKHADDDRNSSFARSTMREALQYLERAQVPAANGCGIRD